MMIGNISAFIGRLGSLGLVSRELFDINLSSLAVLMMPGSSVVHDVDDDIDSLVNGFC